MTELVKVGSEGKYIDLMVDRSFKKIFGTEVNKDRTNYIKSMNTERDTYNQIEYARESGREEGHKVGKEEGRAEGAKQKSFDIAKRMLEKGIDIETISELTGLTAEEVSMLKDRSDPK